MDYRFTAILIVLMVALALLGGPHTMKNNNAMIILGTILLGISSWALMTIVQLEVHIGMLTEEIMSIDKQIGRIYNHMDRLSK
jgi:hypothetical protein